VKKSLAGKDKGRKACPMKKNLFQED